MRVRRRARIFAIQLAVVTLLVVLAELLVESGVISKLVLAKPSAIAVRVFSDLGTAEFWGTFATTLLEVAAALAIAAGLGVPLGLTLYRYRLFRRALEPILIAFYSAPSILLYPIFLTFFGEGSTTVICMAVVLGIVPIAINFSVGLSGVEPIWRKLGRSLNATASQMMIRIMLPAATPIIFAGFRLGFTFALVGVIGVEFLTYSGGLGRLVSWRYFAFDSEGVFAAITL